MVCVQTVWKETTLPPGGGVLKNRGKMMLKLAKLINDKWPEVNVRLMNDRFSYVVALGAPFILETTHSAPEEGTTGVEGYWKWWGEFFPSDEFKQWMGEVGKLQEEAGVAFWDSIERTFLKVYDFEGELSKAE